MYQNPVEVKASQVRLARLALNESHCMVLSPFVVAFNDADTLARLTQFSDDIKKARISLTNVTNIEVPADSARAESVKILAQKYLDRGSDNRTFKLNDSFLKSSGMLLTTLRTLESEIRKIKELPEETATKAALELNSFGIFVDAARLVYRYEALGA